MNENSWAEARESLLAANQIMIVSHTRPDGDAIGSMLGLGLALKNAGKDVQYAMRDGVPGRFHYIKDSELVENHLEPGYDLLVVVDCSDLERPGFDFGGMIPDINFDHHISNTNFARINIVDAEETAAAALLANNLDKLGLELTIESAEAFLTGIITDTIGFRTQNMKPDTFTLAARLANMGLDIFDIYDKAQAGRSFSAIKYWGQGLQKIQQENGIVWTSLSIEDRQAAGYSGNDDADLVNVLSSIENSKIAVIFVEQKNGTVKISWRSKPGYNVSGIAADFGGGGHHAASGAMISGTLEEVQNSVLSATKEIYQKTEEAFLLQK